MNAVEKLEAAISKLEALKAGAPSGPWEWREDFGEPGDTGTALTNGEDVEIIGAYNWHCCSYRDEPNVADGAADLIVTLHRTIDAQLAILRGALRVRRPMGDQYAVPSLAVDLADAILGGTQ